MRAARLRVATALLASTWLLSALVGAIHGGLGKHTYCAEHRTFEEEVRTAAPTSSDTPTIDRVGESEHAECPFADGLRPRAVTTADHLDTGFTLPLVAPPPLRLPDAPAPAVPLLLTAPKSSPPLA